MFQKTLSRQVSKLGRSLRLPSVRSSKFSTISRVSHLSQQYRLRRLSRLSTLSRLSNGFSISSRKFSSPLNNHKTYSSRSISYIFNKPHETSRIFSTFNPFRNSTRCYRPKRKIPYVSIAPAVSQRCLFEIQSKRSFSTSSSSSSNDNSNNTSSSSYQSDGAITLTKLEPGKILLEITDKNGRMIHRIISLGDNEIKEEGPLGLSSDVTPALYDLPIDAGFCHEKKETRAKNRFNGKIAIITGGSGNFGSVIADRLISEGAKVALWDIRSPQDVKKELEEKYNHLNPDILDCIVDVSNDDSVNNALSEVVNKFGRIDYLFNNAGYQGDFTKTHEYKVNDFSKVMDINVTGVFRVLKAVSNAMISQEPQGGSIVNTASMAGHGSPPNMIAYGTSKAAVIHLTRISSLDLAPYNIRVNSISPAYIGPGFMWTRQIELQAAANSIYYDKDPNVVKDQMINIVPMKRYGSLEEVISPVCFLLSDDASYLTGVDIKITGGLNG